MAAAYRGTDLTDYRAAERIAVDLGPLLALADEYVEAGQWANAVATYAALAAEVRERFWLVRAHNGDVGAVLTACDNGLASCLDAQASLPESDRLSPELRNQAVDTIYEIWRFDMVDVGAVGLSEEGPDALARTATPEERERLNTALVELPAKIEDTWSSNWIRGAAVNFQAMLLQEGGQNDEALLELYRDAELWPETAAMLLEMGRVKEATSLAARKLTELPSLTDFATQLLALGDDHVDGALGLVDTRLWETEGADPRQDAHLLQWLAAAYTMHDRPHQALAMARRRFAIRPDRPMYDAVKAAATLPSQPEGTWPPIQRELVKTLEAEKAWAALIDIHLVEGDAKAALAALAKAERGQRGGHLGGLLSWSGAATIDIRVAEAAEPDLPDQAIRLYRRAADRLIERRERASYRQAAEYLARAKRLLATNGRADEWRQLIDDLRATHKSLRALRDELDARDLQ